MNPNQRPPPHDVRLPMSPEVEYETDTDTDNEDQQPGVHHAAHPVQNEEVKYKTDTDTDTSAEEEVPRQDLPQHAQQPTARGVPPDDITWWHGGPPAQQPNANAAGHPVQGEAAEYYNAPQNEQEEAYPFSPFSDDSGRVNPTHVHQEPVGNVGHNAGQQPLPQQAGFTMPEPPPVQFGNPVQQPQYVPPQPQPQAQAPFQPQAFPQQPGPPYHQPPPPHLGSNNTQGPQYGAQQPFPQAQAPGPIPQRVPVGARTPSAQQPQYAAQPPFPQQQASQPPIPNPFADRPTAPGSIITSAPTSRHPEVNHQQPSRHEGSRDASTRCRTTDRNPREDSKAARLRSRYQRKQREFEDAKDDYTAACMYNELNRIDREGQEASIYSPERGRHRDSNAGEGPSRPRRHRSRSRRHRDSSPHRPHTTSPSPPRRRLQKPHHSQDRDAHNHRDEDFESQTQRTLRIREDRGIWAAVKASFQTPPPRVVYGFTRDEFPSSTCTARASFRRRLEPAAAHHQRYPHASSPTMEQRGRRRDEKRRHGRRGEERRGEEGRGGERRGRESLRARSPRREEQRDEWRDRDGYGGSPRHRRRSRYESLRSAWSTFAI